MNKTTIVGVVLFLGLFAWAWSPSLSVGFLADDYEWFRHTSGLAVRDVWKLGWYPALEGVRFSRYRPLVGVSFWADERLWGLRPAGYHLTNLLFHLVAVALVFLLTWKLRKLGGRGGKNGWVAGVLAALIFAANPYLTEAVTWVDGRYDVLASVWVLGASLAYTAFLGSGRKMWFAVALAAAALSILSKELGLVVPLIFCVIAIYNSILRNTMKQFDYSVILRDIGKRTELWIALLLWPAYLVVSRLALGKPFWLEQGYSPAMNRPFSAWVLITVLAVGVYVLRRGRGLAGRLWIPWMLLGLSLAPIALLPTQLRFLYLPSAFAAIWAAMAAHHLGERMRKGKATALLWLVVAFISALLLRERNGDWLAVGNLHARSIERISRSVSELQANRVYLFNFPDSVSGVPAFRSYVKEAIELGSTDPILLKLEVVVGPTPVGLASSSAEVLDEKRVLLHSEAGFLVFEPSVTARYPDGSVSVDWEGDWTAIISAGRKEAVVELPRSLHEEGVLAFQFHEGSVSKIPPSGR